MAHDCSRAVALALYLRLPSHCAAATDVIGSGGDYAAVPDDTSSALRIATRSCIRATGSLPVNRCKQLHDEWRTSQEKEKARGVEAGVNPKSAGCTQLTQVGEEAEWLAEALYGEEVLPHIANFKEMHGVAQSDHPQWVSFKRQHNHGG